jgi:hypothetical protein
MISIQGLKSFCNVMILGLYFLQAQNIGAEKFKISKEGFFCYGTKAVNIPGYDFHGFNLDI